MSNESDAKYTSRQIHRVAVKLPQFWDKEAVLWFINIKDGPIRSRSYVTRLKKCYAVVSTLDSEILRKSVT